MLAEKAAQITELVEKLSTKVQLWPNCGDFLDDFFTMNRLKLTYSHLGELMK
ncbi:MAG: hypothetical protein ACJA06_000293 [Halocynthiibacter sp.]